MHPHRAAGHKRGSTACSLASKWTSKYLSMHTSMLSASLQREKLTYTSWLPQKREELWPQSEQKKKSNPKTLNDTLLHFHNGARHSINANKHSWLSLDIAQFSRLSHANVSDCECSSVGVFNVPAVKTSSVNRQPSTICFFMVWLCLTRSLPSLPS